jgi:signal transduction histidine kinase
MPVEISCPNCSKPIGSEESQCPNCGIDLALAVLLAEKEFADSSPLPMGIQISPEILIPRLGEYLLDRKVITEDDLQVALNHQKISTDNGRPLLLGKALLELGMVDADVLDQVITEQILQLQSALREANRQLEIRVSERTQELQKVLNKLTELNQLKSSFIASVSHELKTPLTHIKGYLDLLAEKELGPLTGEQAEALQVMRRSEIRLEQIIDNLIRFSLASRGELSINWTVFEAAEVVKSSVVRFQEYAMEKQIKLLSEVSPKMPAVKGDAEKIAWILHQLLDNAIKFSKPNSEVLLKASEQGGLVTFSIVDSGIGIPASRLAEIFEPFHQLDGSDTRRYGGTGLGLALAQRILEAHGTTLRVRSEFGRGSCFEFHLPAVGDSYV